MGAGVATEALRLLTDWSFATLGLGRVQVFVAPENDRGAPTRARAPASSARVSSRSYWEIGGERVDAVILARIPR